MQNTPDQNTLNQAPQKSYYQTRCDAIGLTQEKNKLLVKESKALPDSKILEYPIMTEDKNTGDVIIHVYDIDGQPATYFKENGGQIYSGREKFIEVRRYHPYRYEKMCEAAQKDGKPKPGKYHTPKGAKTMPWISPNIIEAFNQGTDIDTIIITEGYIKAISGWLNGLYIFGLSGIQNGKDRDTGALHASIIRTIKERHVNNVILLYDGDCANISLTSLEEEKDLYLRPAGFFASARNLNELLKDHRRDRHFDVYFAHVNTGEEIKAKGLDDLFEECPQEIDKIKDELLSFSKNKPFYFKRINITAGLMKVLNHLHISNQETFYTAHSTIIGEKPFIFNGTKFKYDTEKKELKVIVPGAAKNYFRVGDNYFEKIHVPNKYGVLEYRYVRRQKSTIVEDHGKHLIKHVARYKDFCVKPDHVNYQEIISNCFNRYRPFEHVASTEDSCPETLEFLKHIFGDQDVTFKDANGELVTVNELDLGLDYIQLLYQKPTQILPILCLVSRENNTGKSTFGKLLKAIFTGNMAIIGNADLENDFNAGWADKLIICCEESFIDKKKTVEKIKSLSTGDKIQINQKGVDQIEIDFFGKFLFMSNNEDNFVIANEHDERFWVRRVPKASKERTNLLQIMIEEIPNFLCYLNNRIMKTKNESRQWFNPQATKTDALKKLIEGNKSGPQKELTNILCNLFSDTGFWQLKFTLKYICETLLRNRYERNYIARILRDNFNIKASTSSERFKFPEIQKKTTTMGIEDEIVMLSCLGKSYTFSADKFLTEEEIQEFTLSFEAITAGQKDIAPDHVKERRTELPTLVDATINNQEDDLPF